MIRPCNFEQTHERSNGQRRISTANFVVCCGSLHDSLFNWITRGREIIGATVSRLGKDFNAAGRANRHVFNLDNIHKVLLVCGWRLFSDIKAIGHESIKTCSSTHHHLQ